MSLEIVLPPALEQEIRSLADDEGLSPQDYASLVLDLMTVLLTERGERREGGETPMRRSVHELFAKRGIQSYQVSLALGDLLRFAADVDAESSFAASNGTIDTTTPLGSALGRWEKARQKPRVSAFGKYADLLPSSEEFMREKHEELAREEARLDDELRTRRLRDPGVPA